MHAKACTPIEVTRKLPLPLQKHEHVTKQLEPSLIRCLSFEYPIVAPEAAVKKQTCVREAGGVGILQCVFFPEQILE